MRALLCWALARLVASEHLSEDAPVGEWLAEQLPSGTSAVVTNALADQAVVTIGGLARRPELLQSKALGLKMKQRKDLGRALVAAQASCDASAPAPPTPVGGVRTVEWPTWSGQGDGKDALRKFMAELVQQKQPVLLAQS